MKKMFCKIVFSLFKLLPNRLFVSAMTRTKFGFFVVSGCDIKPYVPIGYKENGRKENGRKEIKEKER